MSLRSQLFKFAGVRCNSTLPNAAIPPKYTLATVRAFPSLEPLTFTPVPTNVLAAPLRRDILWRAVVYENDNKRVGSSNPPGRSDNGYSRRKLFPQKGTGRARAGDANSPIRSTGGRALPRKAPNDFSTELPSKLYSAAFRNALSYQYQQGKLFVIGGQNLLQDTNELDLNELEILPRDPESNDGDLIFKKFLKEYNLQKKKLLFIVSEPRESLLQYTEEFKENVDIVQQEFIDVNDILKAHRIFIELKALEYLAVTHT
ncbi:hypothetical protein ZYGR_0N05770 [Zygosaccharomyces rouxii]|uniref:Large ribosomal subunit protein uL4m n=1 Tax=Zygosaccharomyces rouxii TaxID=4956 RepID=A0A1Q3A0G6_ZYGRO|nr:hypothetical protein ZYGR_0N05770 [Zygosaccharomyces rouxii]